MISVVIPAFNEEKTIRKTLDSLVDQRTATPFEVIVVDNNSTDTTERIIAAYQDKLSLILLHEKKKGRSPARRTGFAHARGKIILSTDADTVVPPDWIDTLIRQFDDPTIAAVTSLSRIDDCGFVINTIVNVYQPVTMLIYGKLFRHTWLSGFSFAIRKEIYKKVGGFDPELNCAEDTELASRVKKVGKIVLLREPIVTISGRRFQQGLIKGAWQYFYISLRHFLFKGTKKVHLSDVR